MLYCQSELLNLAPMGDELVMMDVAQGKYFGLNPIATHIWSLLESPISLDSLVSELMLRFDVTECECRSDTETLLKQLLDRQLVKVKAAA